MRPPVSAGDVAASLALDSGALTALKTQAKADPKAALSAAAGQFEALFVQMLLKSMREALPKDGMLQSDTSRMYTGMFDQQIAQQISRRGIGLKQMLERQLAQVVAAAQGNTAASGATAAAPVAAVPIAAAPAAAVGNLHAAAARAVSEPVGHVSIGDAFSAVRNFVETMRPHAEAAARAVGIPVDLLLAQAGLETGWGQRQPKAADGTASHNLFGIKAGAGWKGSTALAATTEYVAGAMVRTVDRFRAYPSYAEAFQDFAKLIAGSSRFATAVASAGDPVAYAKGLQRGGYATDPQYADKLVHAIRMVASHRANIAANIAATAPAIPASQVVARVAVNTSHEA
jgi:peptidoglycan hydrolase FlgJ